MKTKKELFGKIADESVYAYTFENKNGMSVKILTLGGIVASIIMPDKNGKTDDIVCGFDSIENYLADNNYQGALVGRVANRIKDAEFTLDGVHYTLFKNDGEHSLHGGKEGFNRKIWKVLEADSSSLTLQYISADGEEGYPGKMTVTVKYTFDDENALSINYKAVSDKNTPMNLTNHSYFNLDGYDGEDVSSHECRIYADKKSEVDSNLIPTGNLVPVEGTPYDLRKYRLLDFEYDDNFALNGGGLREVASVRHETSGRGIDVYTDMPGIQLYTGNMMNGDVLFRGGVPQRPHHALCLETQFFPDSVHHSAFPDSILYENRPFESTTRYIFSLNR